MQRQQALSAQLLASPDSSHRKKKDKRDKKSKKKKDKRRKREKKGKKAKASKRGKDRKKRKRGAHSSRTSASSSGGSSPSANASSSASNRSRASSSEPDGDCDRSNRPRLGGESSDEARRVRGRGALGEGEGTTAEGVAGELVPEQLDGSQ